jgi:hypothetical protein
MAETRAARLRRLTRLRRAARRWVVVAAGLVGATAVLTPYAGVGLPDAAWAAGAGVSAALAVFRWRDYHALALQPLPPEQPKIGPGEATRNAMRAALSANPTARAAVDEISRRAARHRFRGSAAAPARERLEVAAATLAQLGDMPSGPIVEAVQEAAVAERSLRDLTERVLTLDRAVRFAGPDGRTSLGEARTLLMARLDDGVTTYERLVAAVATCAAEDGISGDPVARTRLTDAADRMAAFAAGLAELRDLRTPAG